jgi:hypothetical protein
MKGDKEQVKFNAQSDAVQAVRRKEIELNQEFTDSEVVAEIREYLRIKEENELWLSMISDLRRDRCFQSAEA